MNRRHAVRIVWALSAGAAMTRVNVQAQPQGRLFRIGQLGVGGPEGQSAILQAIDAGYRDVGLVEGRNVEIVQRWARGSLDALPALAAELVALPVDVITAATNPSIAAAQRATSTIPIVMVLGVDPVGNGFVESLARPGGNITGLTNDAGQTMHGKMLALLKQFVPAASVIGVLVQQGVGTDRVALEAAARQLKLQLRHAPEVRQPEDIGPTVEALKGGRAQALYVIGGSYIYQNRKTVADLALQHRLPAIFFSSDFVRAGGLVSYGTDLPAQFRRSGWYVAQIFHGAKAAELPVQQPVRFVTTINLKTARALGIVVPQSLMLGADEVIE